MKCLSRSVALALPFEPSDRERTAQQIGLARLGRSAVEVRIGVGVCDRIPARVCAYAEAVAAVVPDLKTLVGTTRPSYYVFGSSPKSAVFDTVSTFLSLAALSAALRRCGIADPIVIELAKPQREVPDSVCPALPLELAQWHQARAREHEDAARSDLDYSHEHAAPSMFGDLADCECPGLTVTVGGATEGRFWAHRMAIRNTVRKAGGNLVPAVGLIIRALRIPWYQPTSREPGIEAVADPEFAVRQLAEAANPNSMGNLGLKREANLLPRALKHDGMAHLLPGVRTSEAALEMLRDLRITLGPRLASAVGELS